MRPSELLLFARPSPLEGPRGRPWGYAPRLVGALALLVALSACGTEPLPPDECAEAPGFAKNVLPGVVTRTCLSCHSVNNVGADRHLAPEDLNYDSFASFTSTAVRSAFADAITSGRMPPTTLSPPVTTTAEERTLVDRWRYCGYKP